ncbi:MAG: adenylate/guanylate cyclase domain-containing protein [Candidatus Hodarchaeales archaeon]|jgi:class 3 adenylate cyclase/predicted ATPase
MNCNNCGAENSESAQFCLKCGNSFTSNCSNCGNELPQGALFCPKCGTKVTLAENDKSDSESSLIEQYIPKELLKKIETAKSSGGIKKERRIVTILFSDLQGSTAAAEQLDPEEWAEIMTGAFEYLIKPVYKYEGMIARLMGDAILAFFGAPIAHEDDPQRAVLSALEILNGINPYLEETRKKWGIDIDIRVGINTGLVVVGEIGSDMRVEYTAMGDAINLASRMESTAEPGTIQITENTYKLVAPLFDSEELGPMNVKGKTDPINTFKVIGQKTTPGKIRGLSGLESPLIGRDNEFNLIIEKVSGLKNGKSHIISIIGEAGLGKSRLIDEINQYLTKNQNDILDNSKICWLQGVSLSYQTNSPYAPFIDMLSKFLNITSEQTNDEKYKIIKDKLFKFPDCHEITPLVANFLDITPVGNDLDKIQYLDPPTMREKTFQAILTLFNELSTHYSLIVVFDDLHWVDQSSLDLIRSIIDTTKNYPLVIFNLFRPRKQERSWNLHEDINREYGHIYEKVFLNSLDEDESKNLVSNLLKIEGLTDKIKNLILSKSEGNPFYIEEMIRSLIDKNLILKTGDRWKVNSDFDDFTMPDTLSGILQTRLDTLDDSSKNVVQMASVIGREFSLEILKDINQDSNFEESLETLEKKELIKLKTRLPKSIYLFKHVMIHDAAYNSLLRKTRMEYHKKVADCIIRIESSNINEIARHYYEAKDFNNAVIYLTKSAERASKSYSNQEAIELYNRAMGIISDSTDPILINDIHIGLGQTYIFLGKFDEATKIYNKLYDLGKESNIQTCQINALNKLGFIKGAIEGKYDEGRVLMEKAENMSRVIEFEPGLLENYVLKCSIETATAQFESAEKHLTEAARLGEKLNNTFSMLYGKTHTANTYVFMTKFDEGLELALETKELAIELNNKQFLSELLSLSIPFSHLRNGDIKSAYDSCLEGFSIAEEIGSSQYVTYASYILLEITLLTGNYQEALFYSNELTQASNNMGFPAWKAVALAYSAKLSLDLGKSKDEIDKNFSEAFKNSVLPSGNYLSATLWVMYGYYNIKLKKFHEAIKYFDKVLDEPTTLMFLYRPAALLGKVSAYLHISEIDKAKENLDLAENYINEKQMKYYFPQLYRVKSDYLVKNEKINEAISELKKSESLSNDLGFIPNLINTKLKLSQIYRDLNNKSEADIKQKESEILLEQMIGIVKDPDIKNTFKKVSMPLLST